MRHDVHRTAGRLERGQGVGVLRVENGKFGVVERRVAAPFAQVAFPGDDAGITHFTARSGDRDDNAQRQDAVVFARAVEQIPWVAIVAGGVGNGLGRVDDAAAAYGQHQLNLLLFAEGRTFLNQSQPGIGLYAGNFPDAAALFVQHLHDLVVKADPLDAATAVDQQHPVAVMAHFLVQMGKRISAKINFCRNLQRKINHEKAPFALSLFVGQKTQLRYCNIF